MSTCTLFDSVASADISCSADMRKLFQVVIEKIVALCQSQLDEVKKRNNGATLIKVCEPVRLRKRPS